MSKAVKIILGILLFGIVACAVCVGVGYHWVQNNKGRLMEDAKRVDREASLYAAVHPQDSCLDESLLRLSAAEGFMDQAMTKIFLNHCLDHAQPSPGLCAGVPGGHNILESATWAVRMCEARKMGQSQPCAQLVQGLAEHCRKQSQ